MRLLQIIAALVLFALPAHAGNQAMAADRCEGLATSTGLSSFVFDLSSFCANSYQGSGQTINNLIASPADSNTQAYHDFHIGDTSSATATDPTFTGLGGHKGDYFALDGGDFITHKAGAAPGGLIGNMSCETTIAGTCTSTPSWTLNVVFKYIDNGAIQWIAGTSNANATPGFALQISSADQVQLRRNNGAANNTISTGITLTGNTTYFLSFTFVANTMAWKASVNGATYSATGTGTTLVPNNTIGSGTFTVGTTNKSTSTPLASGSIIYSASLMNAVASDANLAAIAAVYEARTGLDLTP